MGSVWEGGGGGVWERGDGVKAPRDCLPIGMKGPGARKNMWYRKKNLEKLYCMSQESNERSPDLLMQVYSIYSSLALLEIWNFVFLHIVTSLVKSTAYPQITGNFLTCPRWDSNPHSCERLLSARGNVLDHPLLENK